MGRLNKIILSLLLKGKNFICRIFETMVSGAEEDHGASAPRSKCVTLCAAHRSGEESKE